MVAVNEAGGETWGMWRALEEKCEKSAKGGEALYNKMAEKDILHAMLLQNMYSTWEFNLMNRNTST